MAHNDQTIDIETVKIPSTSSHSQAGQIGRLIEAPLCPSRSNKRERLWLRLGLDGLEAHLWGA
jgi:hypothetical protein